MMLIRIYHHIFGRSSQFNKKQANQFNQEERVQNVCKILGKSDREYLPHYVTINDC
jgi:hypothetical protein